MISISTGISMSCEQKQAEGGANSRTGAKARIFRIFFRGYRGQQLDICKGLHIFSGVCAFSGEPPWNHGGNADRIADYEALKMEFLQTHRYHVAATNY